MKLNGAQKSISFIPDGEAQKSGKKRNDGSTGHGARAGRTREIREAKDGLS